MLVSLQTQHPQRHWKTPVHSQPPSHKPSCYDWLGSERPGHKFYVALMQLPHLSVHSLPYLKTLGNVRCLARSQPDTAHGMSPPPLPRPPGRELGKTAESSHFQDFLSR